jgi:hypothetical protein
MKKFIEPELLEFLCDDLVQSGTPDVPVFNSSDIF